MKSTPKEVATIVECSVREACNSAEAVKSYNHEGVLLPDITYQEISDGGNDDFFAEVNAQLRAKAGMIIMVSSYEQRIKVLPLKVWLIEMVLYSTVETFKAVREDLLKKIEGLGEDIPETVKTEAYTELVESMSVAFIKEKHGGKLGLLNKPTKQPPAEKEKWC